MSPITARKSHFRNATEKNDRRIWLKSDERNTDWALVSPVLKLTDDSIPAHVFHRFSISPRAPLNPQTTHRRSTIG